MSTTTPKAAALKLWQLGANITAIPVGEKAPVHKWNSRGALWTSERQPREFLGSIRWRDRAEWYQGACYQPIETIGTIDGIGADIPWRTIDVDAMVGDDGQKIPVPDSVRQALLAALGLPDAYPWGGRSKNGKGWHVKVRCAGELPDDIAAARSDRSAADGGGAGVKIGTPNAAFEGAFGQLELRWENCQSVLPSPTGYNGHLPDDPPAEVTVDQVVAAFRAVAAPKAAKAPRAAAQATTRPAARTDAPRERIVWNDAVEAQITDHFDLVDWFRQELGGETQDEPGGQVRILGHSGLIVQPDTREWFIYGETTGGRWIKAVAHTRYGGSVPTGRAFFDLVRIAAEFAGVRLEVEAPAGHTAAPTAPQAPTGPTAAPAAPQAPTGAVVTVDITDENLGRATDAIWTAMLSSHYAPGLYRYGSEIAYLNGHLTTVDDVRWRGMVNRAASFITTKQGKAGVVTTEVIPPLAMIRDSLVFTPDTLPVIDRVSPLPVFDRNGVMLGDGYHADQRILVTANIPIEPIDWRDARRLILDELLVDFPFASAADRANAVAYLLLPFVREICGATPLFLIDAAQRGTGKTLLNDLVHEVWTGAPAPLSDLPLNAEEQRKAITTHLMSGPVSVVFDDISLLQGHALQRAVTGQIWNDRLLGSNREVALPIRTIWAATGNNVTLGGDMVRRTVLVRLESTEERPSERTGFRRTESDIRAWARASRATLVSACVSLIAHGLRHGRPGGVTFGGFDQFARTMARILDGIEVNGFCANMPKVYDREDGRQAGWKAIVRDWWDTYGDKAIKAGDVAKLIEDNDDCEIVLDGDSARARATTAGKLLKAKIGAVFAYEDVRLRLDQVKNTKGDTVYRLWEVPPTGGGNGDIPHQDALAEHSEHSEHSPSPSVSDARARARNSNGAPMSAMFAMSASASGRGIVVPPLQITTPSAETLFGDDQPAPADDEQPPADDDQAEPPAPRRSTPPFGYEVRYSKPVKRYVVWLHTTQWIAQCPTEAEAIASAWQHYEGLTGSDDGRE